MRGQQLAVVRRTFATQSPSSKIRVHSEGAVIRVHKQRDKELESRGLIVPFHFCVDEIITVASPDWHGHDNPH